MGAMDLDRDFARTDSAAACLLRRPATTMVITSRSRGVSDP